jgi:hypothetical protein
MAKQFTTKIRKSPGEKYLKVFFYNPDIIDDVIGGINELPSVDHANITENHKDDLTVYPAKTSEVEETEQEVEHFLTEYFSEDSDEEE